MLFAGRINLGCHGIPERCLVVRGKRMQICARCFGSTIGHCLAIGCLVIGWFPPWPYAALLLLPLLVDWSLQEFAGLTSNHVRRVATGILGGFGLGGLLWGAVFHMAYALIGRR